MKLKIITAAALLVAAHGVAMGAPKEAPPPDTVLLENGPAKVTVKDFDAAMTRFPKGLRDEARAYPAVIIRNIDAIFVNRVAANSAKAAGLDKDPVVQQRMVQLQEAYLAQAYLDHLYDTVKLPDLSLRAEEIYKSDPKRWTLPSSATLDDIAVSFLGRTPEMALERAKEAELRIRGGEDFLTVGAQYSDDRNFVKSRGDLGSVRLADLEEPLRQAVEGMKAGDISAPIRTTNAAHILRVRERSLPRQRSFAEVKLLIMGEEEERLRKKATEDYVLEVRNSSSNVLYKDRVESLRVELDLSKIDAARARAIEQVQGQALSAPR